MCEGAPFAYSGEQNSCFPDLRSISLCSLTKKKSSRPFHGLLISNETHLIFAWQAQSHSFIQKQWLCWQSLLHSPSALMASLPLASCLQCSPQPADLITRYLLSAGTLPQSSLRVQAFKGLCLILVVLLRYFFPST